MHGSVFNARQDELLERVHRALDRMPEPRRNVFLLSRVDKLTYAEIAVLYGMGPARVRRMVALSMSEALYVTNVGERPSLWVRLRWWLHLAGAGLPFRRG